MGRDAKGGPEDPSRDPRAVRTRARLAEAFTAVAARHPGAPVSVSSIVAEAGLNRSSFYAHFDTTGSLAVYVLEQALRDISEQDVQVRLVGAATGRDASRIVIGHILDQVEGQRTELLAVFGSAEGGAATARFGRQLADNIAYYFQRIRPSARPDRELATTAVFLGHGLAAAIVDWLTAADPCPRVDLVDVLVGLVPDWVHAAGGPRTHLDEMDRAQA
ncbi:TetR/AcrR family transcriptional regulator [Catellatospora sp. NPDC049609]|uniref:TetR/AcrR family transcriptional regulator n=1 Tax=Catellatospora sp. NPDC049609 TaxID=3155505 RepID=UPI0034344526